MELKCQNAIDSTITETLFLFKGTRFILFNVAASQLFFSRFIAILLFLITSFLSLPSFDFPELSIFATLITLIKKPL